MRSQGGHSGGSGQAAPPGGLEDEARGDEAWQIIFSGRCCFHLAVEEAPAQPVATSEEEVASSPSPLQQQAGQGVTLPSQVLYFGGSSKDPTELSFELGLRTGDRKKAHRPLAIAVFDGAPYSMDLAQVEQLVCVGMEEHERMQDRPPFVRLAFPCVNLQFYPGPGFEWKAAVKQLHRCVRKLLATFGPGGEALDVKAKPASATTTTTTTKRREDKKGKERREEDEDEEEDAERSDHERHKERKRRRVIKEEGEEEEEKDEAAVDRDKAVTVLEEARAMYEGGSWAELMAFLPNLSQLDEDSGLAEVKQLIERIAHLIPRHYARLFPPDNGAQLQRSRRESAVVMDELARLHERCLGAHGAAEEVACMKRRLARDKSELEAHVAQVMGLLFPQKGRRAGDKVVDARQIALLEELHRKVEDMCEVEMLLEILSQR